MLIITAGDCEYTDVAYTYDTPTPRQDEAAEVGDHVARLNADGWRLVFDDHTGSGRFMIFRRPRRPKHY